IRLRPPPGRRTRWVDAVWGACNSANPAAIARRETPVARATRVIPPRPSAAASAAEKSRRVRSLRNGVSISNRVWMADSSSIAGAYHPQTRHCYTYFVTGSYINVDPREPAHGLRTYALGVQLPHPATASCELSHPPRCPFHKFAASQAAARLYGLGG